jgi:exodeoxyribonuclease VII small subunit
VPGKDGRVEGVFRMSREDKTQEDKTTQQDKTQEDRSFEECLQSLEKVVERIESGELSLEDSLATFEEGVRLVQSCNRKLSDVERRIEVLTKDSDGQAQLRELVDGEAPD